MAAPDPVTWFTGQVRQQVDDIDQICRSLDDLVASGEVSAAIRDRFLLLLREHAERFREIQADAEALGRPRWAALRSARAGTRDVKAAALGFLQGLLLRQQERYRGLNTVVDRMLGGLAERTGVDSRVLLGVADGEFFDRSVRMVSLRFPDTTVWGLPILAHEFGHHVAYALAEIRQPVQKQLDELEEDELDRGVGGSPEVRGRLNELFADVYAGYVLGPAYPLCLVELRAQPDRFDDHTATHPSWTRRVWTTVAALRVMGERADSPLTRQAYRIDADQVEARWRTLTGDEPPEDKDQELVVRQAEALVKVLARYCPPRLAYDPTRQLEPLVAALGEQHELAGDGPTIVDLLNAAWRWRVGHPAARPHEAERVSRATLRACERAAA